MYPNDKNKTTFSDYALIDHVLTTFQVTWEWGCVEKCQQDTWCRSFNFQRRSLGGSHFFSCEISWSTRVISENQYRYSPGVTYHEPEVNCFIASIKVHLHIDSKNTSKADYIYRHTHRERVANRRLNKWTLMYSRKQNHELNI